MADGEHRMLFDTRGKRKHVIRVVYAVLALLMGASLFLVVGPFNLAELAGGGGNGDASEVFEEQIDRIEGRLAKSPQDEQLLLTLTRAQINSGNAKIDPVAAGEVPTVEADAQADFDAAWESWNRYLKLVGDEPNAPAAQIVALTFFRAAESNTSVNEAAENIAKATKAQRIATEERPSINSRATLAIYEYFNGEYAAGDKSMKEAAAEAGSKAQAKVVEEQLAEYRKNSKEFDQQRKELAKVQGRVNKERLQNPLGLGGTPGTVGE